MGRSHLLENRTINSINLPSCSCALPVNLDTNLPLLLNILGSVPGISDEIMKEVLALTLFEMT
jgi:hypothetical protein